MEERAQQNKKENSSHLGNEEGGERRDRELEREREEREFVLLLHSLLYPIAVHCYSLWDVHI